MLHSTPQRERVFGANSAGTNLFAIMSHTGEKRRFEMDLSFSGLSYSQKFRLSSAVRKNSRKPPYHTVNNRENEGKNRTALYTQS